MTPEERAKAVVAYFPAVPPKIRGELENVIARAIKRAVGQQLAELEAKADRDALHAEGRGKQAKGRDPSAIQFHRQYQRTFQILRARQFAPAQSRRPCQSQDVRSAGHDTSTRLVLRHLATQLYLSPGDAWTDDRTLAVNFERAQDLNDAIRRLRLTEALGVWLDRKTGEVVRSKVWLPDH